MYHATIPHKLFTLKSRHSVVLAWLLLATQLFSQLHGLEHLDAADHDEHSEEVCQLCILSSGLDHGGIDAAVTISARFQAPQLPVGYWKSITLTTLPTYQSRAPPSSPSIA